MSNSGTYDYFIQEELDALLSRSEEGPDSRGWPASARRIVRERLRLERALSDVSLLLLGAEPAGMDGALSRMLAVLGRALELDRAVLYRLPSGEGPIRLRASFLADGVGSHTALPDAPLDGVTSKSVPLLLERTSAGEMLSLPSITELPSGPERELLQRHGVVSMLVIPVLAEGAAAHLLSFESLAAERSWLRSEVDLCCTARNLLAGALERHIMLEALSRSQRLSRTILDSMQAAVSLVDVRTHEIVDANRFYLEGIGKERSEVVGRHCHEVSAEHGYACLGPSEGCPTHMAEAPISGPVRIEREVRAPDGEVRSFEVCLSPVPDDAGRVTQVVHLVQDVTAHRRAEEDLRRATEVAEAASVAKSALLANVSHELRTPLNPIVAMSRLLEMTSLDEEQLRYVELIQRGADQLLSTVNDLLDISKAEAGRLELQREGFDLEELLDGCVGLCEAECRRRGLTLRRRVDRDVPRRVVGDPHRLQQVLHNLIGNAMKFTKRGGVRLHVSLHESLPDGVRLRFEVADTGMGVAPEHKDAIFESFTQVDPSISRRSTGTGLGLAICKQIVTHMGGRIGVKDGEGRGSIFWFTATLGAWPEPLQTSGYKGAPASLEVSKMAHPQLDPQPRAQSLWGTQPPVRRPNGEPMRVLVVDDDAPNQSVARQILSQGGYLADVAGSGAEALERLLTTEYDLVLMDVEMPGMDGLEVARRIRDGAGRGLPARIPIVIASAFAQPDDQERCTAAGVDGYVSKPMEPRRLLDLLRGVLDLRAS